MTYRQKPITRTVKEIARDIDNAPTDSVPAGIIDGWNGGLGASIFDNANLSASKGASIFDNANLSASKAASIMEDANLSKSKCYDILSDANLSDSKFGDILDNSPEGPNVPKATVTEVGTVFDSKGHDAVMGIYLLNANMRWTYWAGTLALDSGVNPATKIVKKVAPDISYKFCVFTDPDGTVADGFASPDAEPQGATWDGTYLWLVGKANYYVYKLKTDGSIAGGWITPVTGQRPRDLAWDGTYLWHSEGTPDYIYKLKTDGTVIGGFNAPANPFGLTWDGTNLWNATGANYIYKLDTDGNVTGGFATPSGPWGLTWDGTYLWYADSGNSYIYKLKTDGSVVGGWNSPAPTPEALTWDGTYLWSGDESANYIYKLSGGTATYTKIADLVY